MKNGWHLNTLLIFAALLTGCLPAILIAQEGRLRNVGIELFAAPDPGVPTVSSNDGPSGLEQTVGTIATGVAGSVTMGGLCWYMVAHALPAKDKCNEKQREDHLAQQEKQQAMYIAELREERIAHREAMKEYMAQLEAERKEFVAQLEAERKERLEMVRTCELGKRKA